MSTIIDELAKVTSMIRKTVPNIDDAIVDYVIGYLDETPSLVDSEDAIGDFIRPILLDAGGEEKAIQKLCDKLSELFIKVNESTNKISNNRLAKLEQPVNMLSQEAISATARIAPQSVDLEAVSGRKVSTRVDTKKLEKAEAKIKAKLEKRVRKTNYEASKLIQKKDQDAEFYMKVNPILDYTTTKGKVKDVKIENFDISFGGKRILTNANLTLVYGRRYGLVGRNGIGKSTLLRTLSRREINVPTHISILHVEQEMAGDDTPAIQAVLSADIWREHLIEEEKSLNAKIVELEKNSDEIDKASSEAEKEEANARLKEVYQKLEEIESDKAESRAASILSGLGFPTDKHNQPTRTFSGGWRMRLALARALFCRPDLLLLDEPTNMLDIPAVAWIEHYLQKWQNTLLVVSHDREFLDEVATDILHQHSERLDYYKGNFTKFYATKEERRKSHLREYESQMQQRQHLQDFIDRWRYNAKRGPQAQSKLKILEKLPVLDPPEVETNVTFRFPNPDSLNPPILQLNEVSFGYKPGETILSDVNLSVQLDSCIAVVGPNGSGKSTLLKLLTGILEPISGQAHRHGRLRFAHFMQHHVDQLDLDTNAVSFMAKQYPGKSEEEYRRQLGNFGITGMTSLQPLDTLSGGQKSRVSFACLGLQYPHILILDEPTNHLDMDSIDALTNALKEFKGGVILVSHDERFIDSVCQEIWVCEKGKVRKFEGDNIRQYRKMIVPKDEP
ncbi:7783_t:CDS:10 [Entrophospora sp. SA101]|nr:5859_t:CDS:10 [Entrophospora sp. SA101]CAJ0639939.1 7783_t:CDS:10 [Entrophospora sp. SA101]CAJ0849405.1 6997_t:CDS:10 [Entrophospora sp. SA101]CAJ0852407.1 7313_t:CDS:10 [Entrophospora sp. SA101]